MTNNNWRLHEKLVSKAIIQPNHSRKAKNRGDSRRQRWPGEEIRTKPAEAYRNQSQPTRSKQCTPSRDKTRKNGIKSGGDDGPDNFIRNLSRYKYKNQDKQKAPKNKPTVNKENEQLETMDTEEEEQITEQGSTRIPNRHRKNEIIYRGTIFKK